MAVFSTVHRARIGAVNLPFLRGSIGSIIGTRPIQDGDVGSSFPDSRRINIIPVRGSSPVHDPKVWLRRSVATLVLLIALIAALCATGLLPYFLAAYSSNITLLAFSAVLVFAFITWGGGWLGAMIWHANRRARFACAFSGLLTATFVIALYVTVLRPSPTTLAEVGPSGVVPFDNTRYWQLPSGSRIAYSEYDPPRGTAIRSTPILFLHGGPGLRVGPYDLDFYSRLAADGFRVYLFDQAGTGRSGSLPSLRDYTISRSVEDIEAIRRQIGTDKAILIGFSFGSTLAASYMAKYPDHVAKTIFYSPGPMWNYAEVELDYSRGDAPETSTDIPVLRLIAAAMLLNRSEDAAKNLLPRREAEEQVMGAASVFSTMVCKGGSNKLPPMLAPASRSELGDNPYASLELLLGTLSPASDPHTILRSNKTPAIVLFGECEFLTWSSALDYRKTLPNLNIYYIPRAGHFMQLEQPELMMRVIRAFLLDQTDAVPPYSGDADPRTVRP